MDDKHEKVALALFRKAQPRAKDSLYMYIFHVPKQTAIKAFPGRLQRARRRK